MAETVEVLSKVRALAISHPEVAWVLAGPVVSRVRDTERRAG